MREGDVAEEEEVCEERVVRSLRIGRRGGGRRGSGESWAWREVERRLWSESESCARDDKRVISRGRASFGSIAQEREGERGKRKGNKDKNWQNVRGPSLAVISTRTSVSSTFHFPLLPSSSTSAQTKSTSSSSPALSFSVPPSSSFFTSNVGTVTVEVDAEVDAPNASSSEVKSVDNNASASKL